MIQIKYGYSLIDITKYLIYSILYIISNILVWLFLFITIGFFYIVLNIIIIVSFIYQLIRFQKIPRFLSDEELEYIEKHEIIKHFPENTVSNTISILNCNIHSFIVDGDLKNGNDLILLHGTFSTGFHSWKNSIFLMKQKYRKIHIIDLPGFGRSKVYNNDLSKLNHMDLINFIVNILARYIIIFNIKKPTIVGTSVSCYIAIILAYQYPELLEKLILVSPIAILPTLGKYGFYIAIMFKYILPYISNLGRGGLCYVYTFFNNNETIYDFNIRLNPDNNINCMVKNFIDVDWHSACFKIEILFPILTKLKVLFGIIYGYDDLITPSHTGKIVSSLMNFAIPVEIVDKAGHSPHYSHSEEFFEVFLKTIDNAKTCNNLKITEKYRKINWLDWRTSFLVNRANTEIHDFYKYLSYIKLI